MDNITLPTTAFPKLTESIKRTIGLSLWSLFQIHCEIEGVNYLLKTPEQSFFLNEEGDIIKIVEDDDHVDVDCRVFFEGYSFPSEVKLNSISNTVCR